MKTFFYTLVFFAIINPAFSEEYNRKKVMPNYFMPKSDVEYKDNIVAKKRVKSSVASTSAPKPKTTQATYKKNDDEPDFTNIFDEYKKDVTEISKTRQYPDTSKIKNDYQGMNSNAPFLVK